MGTEVREFGIDLYTPSFSCISSSPYYWLQLCELQRLYLPLNFLLVEEGGWFFSRYCLPEAKILSILQKLIQFILRLMLWTQTQSKRQKKKKTHLDCFVKHTTYWQNCHISPPYSQPWNSYKIAKLSHFENEIPRWLTGKESTCWCRRCWRLGF